MFSARLRGSFVPSPPFLTSLPFHTDQFNPISRRLLRNAAPALLAIALGASAAGAQDHTRTLNASSDISSGISSLRALPDHVPSWANDSNFLETMPAEQAMEPMTLVLARHPDRELAFEKLLADQQDPASPQYHHWLTPTQIGERYGLSTSELEALSGWLQSQGLHVDWVAPARNFIGFSGAAGDVADAFRTRLNYYRDEDKRKVSLASAPLLPPDLAPMVKAIHGLYTIENRPMSRVRAEHSASPNLTASNGENFIAQDDFDAIYNVTYPNSPQDTTIKIGIVGRSRVDLADIDNFVETDGGYVQYPIEIVPKKFGGVDPGSPRTSPPPSGISVADQAEATLDVERAGSFPWVRTLLVVTTANHGDIGADAQYLVQTEPLPAPVMNISFGECESKAGRAGVEYWDSLFQQAAAEGISVFVASGDSGASGCDAAFSSPPANPMRNSPNYICSSSYATCVGGTEFNDLSGSYWNDPESYIPEGAWNEPLNSHSETQVASSGGGVSQYILTPNWQTGKGVPAARAGRYTPDVAFSAAEHDAYFGCFAAGGGSCVITDGSFDFVGFAGTSAAAPDMAGVIAILDQNRGNAQGYLNPALYTLAATTPAAFHDITVATSGVVPCVLSTPSMCNNSIPGPSALLGGQPGFEAGPGYDEVTGLGSLDVGEFLQGIAAPFAPTVTTERTKDVSDGTATLSGMVNPNGLETIYWFDYSTSYSLLPYANTGFKSAGSGTVPVNVLVSINPAAPKTTFYYRLIAKNAGGTINGKVLGFTTPKGSQIIELQIPASPQPYGKKITLEAYAISEIPVEFSVLSGPGRLSGSTLALTGLGTVVVAANQPGNSQWLPAPQVTVSIAVDKAVLKVAANDLTMTQGGKVPPLTYTITGFVNNDKSSVVSGTPILSTPANSESKPGKYHVSIRRGSLQSSRYRFALYDGALTVEPKP
jgi:subtilase family serine protease